MIGKSIGRYRILRKLGEGGMGAVWEAEHPVLDRRVALKIPSQKYSASEAAKQRFINEAKLASILDHPGIATVYDAGEDEGHLFIASKLVQGRTLQQLIACGPIPESAAVRIAVEAAEALDHAHERGIIHRDISSRNIMLDENGSAVVVDFGLALLEGASRLTDQGQTMGTVPYMAPEVVAGGDSDRRSDLFSLGVVFYEMLTGQLPFSGERHAVIVYAILHRDPIHPRALIPQVSQKLNDLVLQLIAKEPASRPQSARDLVGRLRELRGASPPEAGTTEVLSREAAAPRIISGRIRVERRSPGPSEEAGTGDQRRRLWARWTLGVAAVAILLVAAWLTAGSLIREPNARFGTVAVLPFQSLGPSTNVSALSEGTMSTLITKLAKLPDLRVTPWLTSRRYRDPSLRIEDVADELQVSALVIGTIQDEGGEISINLGIVDAASGRQIWAEEYRADRSTLLKTWGDMALDIGREITGDLRSEEREALAADPAASLEAFEFHLKGVEALQHTTPQEVSRALVLFERAIQLDPELAEAYVGIGLVHSDRYYYGWEGGQSNLVLAERNCLKALELDRELMSARRGLIRVHWERDEAEKMISIAREVRAMPRQTVGSLMVQAEAVTLASLPDLAIPILEQVLQFDPTNEGAHWFLLIAGTYGGRDRKTIEAGSTFYRRFGEDPVVLSYTAAAHYQLQQYEEADFYFRRAMDLHAAGAADNHLTGLMYSTLLREMGKSAKADSILARGRKVIASSVAAYPDNARMRAFLRGYMAMQGDWDAVELERERTRGLPLSTVLTSWLIVALLKEGRFDDASREFLDLLEQRPQPRFWPRRGMITDTELQRMTDISPRIRTLMEEETRRRRALLGDDLLW